MQDDQGLFLWAVELAVPNPVANDGGMIVGIIDEPSHFALFRDNEIYAHNSSA